MTHNSEGSIPCPMLGVFVGWSLALGRNSVSFGDESIFDIDIVLAVYMVSEVVARSRSDYT